MPTSNMELSFHQLTPSGALLSCFGLSSVFVVSLYVVHPGLSRNHPTTVRRRLLATLFVCAFSPLCLWLLSDGEYSYSNKALLTTLGIRSEGLLPAVLCPLLLVLVLYAGPIYLAYVDKEPLFEHITSERTDLNIRNYVWAPFAEEFVFRACMLPLLIPQFGDAKSVLICPLFFGMAHVHHLIEWARHGRRTPFAHALLTILIQVCYTSIFGMFSALLFVRSGHLTSPVVSHSLCNIMGLPSFEFVPSHPLKNRIAAVYVIGLLLFIALLGPLTQPHIYINNHL